MNAPDPFDRIRGQLRRAATEIRLRPGSELATIRAAQRRRTRTRAFVGAATVVAVGGGTAVAIRQLGTTSSDGLAVGTGDGTVPDRAIAPGPTAVLAPTTTVVYPAGSVPPGSPEVPTQPAQLVDPTYTWNALTPEAATTLGPWRGRVPGVIVATAPGPNDPNSMPTPKAYYTADGITFEPLDATGSQSLNAGGRLFADGDSIYRVGTAPGVAEDSANPMLVEVSTDRGVTWETIELPLDTHRLRALPYVAAYHSVDVVSTGAGALILVNEQVGWDYRQIEQLEVGAYIESTPDGFLIGEQPCGPVATTTPPYVPAPTVPDSIPDTRCSSRLYSWDELGIPTESVEAVMNQTAASRLSMYRVVDGEAVAVDPPEGVSVLSSDGSGDGALNAYSESEQAAVHLDLLPDGSWRTTALPPAVSFHGGLPAASATHEFTMLSPQGLGGNVLAAGVGGEWSYTDLRSLYGEFMLVHAMSHAITPDGFAVSVATRPDVVVEQGGVQVAVGSAIVRRTSEFGQPEVVDAASGQPIDGAQVQHVDDAAQPSGSAARVVAPDGSVLGEIDALDFERGLYPDQTNVTTEWSLLTTADGLHIAQQSVAELAGVSDADISSVRVNAVDRQLIATVVLREEVSPGLKRQIILVGTPNE